MWSVALTCVVASQSTRLHLFLLVFLWEQIGLRKPSVRNMLELVLLLEHVGERMVKISS